MIFQETEYKLKVDELLNENEAYKLDCGRFAAQLTLINNTNNLEIEKLKIQVFDWIFLSILIVFVYNS